MHCVILLLYLVHCKGTGIVAGCDEGLQEQHPLGTLGTFLVSLLQHFRHAATPSYADLELICNDEMTAWPPVIYIT